MKKDQQDRSVRGSCGPQSGCVRVCMCTRDYVYTGVPADGLGKVEYTWKYSNSHRMCPSEWESPKQERCVFAFSWTVGRVVDTFFFLFLLDMPCWILSFLENASRFTSSKKSSCWLLALMCSWSVFLSYPEDSSPTNPNLSSLNPLQIFLLSFYRLVFLPWIVAKMMPV